MLTRDQILAAPDARTEAVSVPEWGGDVFVKVMSGSERDRFEAAHLKSPDQDVRARLVVATACDAAGKPLFTPDDVAAVGAKSAPALDRLFAAAVRLNAIGKADVERLEKNS